MRRFVYFRERTGSAILILSGVLFFVPSAYLAYAVIWDPLSGNAAYRVFITLGWFGELLAFFGVMVNGLARLPGPAQGPRKPRSPSRRLHIIVSVIAHFLGNAFLGASLAVFGFGETLVVFFMIVFSTATIVFALMFVWAERGPSPART